MRILATGGNGECGAAADPSDRIWTVPNILSFIRLLGIPVFLWLVLVEQADVWAFVVLCAG